MIKGDGLARGPRRSKAATCTLAPNEIPRAGYSDIIALTLNFSHGIVSSGVSKLTGVPFMTATPGAPARDSQRPSAL